MQILSLRVPEEFFNEFNAAAGDAKGARTEALREALNDFLAKRKRISPTVPVVHKANRELKPLAAHHKARLKVYEAFTHATFHQRTTVSRTSSEISAKVSQTTNNVAKRLGELYQEGYVEPTGEYRKSRDSGKMLVVWRRTDKPLPQGVML